VIVHGRGDGVVRHVLVFLVMVVLAGAGGICVMGHGVRVGLDRSRGRRRQLQTCALPPGRRAGDKRKRDTQSQDLSKTTTHRMMLGRVHDGRQKFFRGARQQSFDQV